MSEPSSKMRVLVLDDEVAFLDLCRKFLRGCETMHAEYVSSPAKALEMAAEGDYQVIVSDHSLPGMDGLQFLRALRSMCRRIPFVMLIGNGREELAIDALQNGADFYLEKAGSPRSMCEQLMSAIRTLGERGRTGIRECLPDPFQVFSRCGVLLVSNGGERVLAAAG